MSEPSLLDRSSLSIDEAPFARVLRAVADRSGGMTARFRSGLVDKTVVFEDGVPVDCRSNMVQDTLSRFMVRLGRISREQETQLLQRAASQNKLFGEVARDAGVVDASEIFRLLQQNLAKKLLDLFTWEEGSIQIHREVPPVEAPLKVNVGQLVLTGCTRFVPKSEVDLAVGDLVGQRVVLRPEPPFALGSLRFSRSQARLLEVLEEPAGLSDLTAGSDLGFEDTTRFVYALIVLGIVVSEEDARARPSSGPFDGDETAAALPVPTLSPRQPVPSVVRPTAPEPDDVDEPIPELLPDIVDVVAPAPPEVGLPVEATSTVSAPSSTTVSPTDPSFDAMDVARRSEDVMNTYLNLRRVDARGLLGIPPRSSPSELRTQFLAFCERFAPWTFRDPRLAFLEPKVEELFLAGVRAFHELGGIGAADDQIESALESGAPSGAEEADAPPESSGQMIRRAADELTAQAPTLLDPEVHFEEGLRLRQEGEFTKALNALEIAVQCDPQNGVYRAEAAWTFYQRSPGTGAETARDQLQKALRVEPGCGLALFYSGELSRILGEYDVAEEFLKKSIKPMAPDRRPIEKLHDLRKIRRSEGG